MLEAERDALAAACRRLHEEGLVVGSAGNLSVRAGDHVAVTGSGGALGSMTAADMPVVDMAGRVVHPAAREPTSELQLHLALYERLGAGAVVHTHAPVATALSAVVQEVPGVHYGMLAFGGSLRVAPYATFGTAELAANVLAAMEGRTAALMQNHGAVSIGPDLDTAVESALLVEWSCRVYWTARVLGEPSVLGDEQLAEVAAQMARLSYGRRRRDAPG